MRKIVLASHGELADGLKHTLRYFAGDRLDITTICAYVDEISVQEKIEQFFHQTNDDDEVLIFTDLFGGSVNRAFLPYMHKKHVHLITGVFLGIILELIYRKEDYLSEDEISEVLKKTKESIVYMNQFQFDYEEDEV